jgi:hypothetical protein
MIPRRRTLYKSELVYSSGDNPILVTCTDFLDRVCKHGRLTPSILFNEVVGSKFAECWNLKTPPISLIDVDEEHLPDTQRNIVQPAFFRKPCFGSLYIQTSTVIDQTVIPSFRKDSFRRKIANKNDLLKIALFDIWLGNEDRHQGNSNLLLDQSLPKEYYFNVFDHGAIFNTNSLKYGIQLITDNESLVHTDISKILFGRINNLSQIVDNIVEDFYLCVVECEEEIENIISDIPPEWSLDLENLEVLIRKNIFTQEWYENCENHFRTLIQEYI